MMINVADLPAVRAQIQRAAADKASPTAQAPDAPQFARAPTRPGPQVTGARPSATQGKQR
ncbi:hypothetical protein [Massilia sp.]|uniref:hypothetical protein n=1 Tax=Massilia sp. TaxID=1882437 RepID=UPI00352C89C1